MPTECKCELKRNVISDLFDERELRFMKEHGGDFVISNSTVKHLEKSVMKMDAKVNKSFQSHPGLFQAMDFTAQMYDPAFRTGEMDFYSIMAEVVGDTSAGVIESLRGLQKKNDCLLAGLPYFEYDNPDLEEIPIWKVSGKVEVKHRSEYTGLLKQRTFIIEPFHHLWKTKQYYGLQNKGLQMLGWSYYGFNPYDGGVGVLGRMLVKHKRFWELDGKGWDRLLSMMKEIYSLRNRYRLWTPELEWTYSHLIKTILQLPNGDVVEKDWGNNSGSGNTTGDNICGMTIALSLVFFHLGLSREEILEKVSVAVFGDDVVGSDSTHFSDEQLERGFRHVFTEMFGIELDPFIITRDVADLHFLGFQIARCKGSFIPKYPLDRLCASALGNLKTMDVKSEVCKLSSLMLMSAGNGEHVFNFFRRSLLDVILKSDDDYCIGLRKQNIDFIIPKYDRVIDWYLGFEGDDQWCSSNWGYSDILDVGDDLDDWC